MYRYAIAGAMSLLIGASLSPSSAQAQTTTPAPTAPTVSPLQSNLDVAFTLSFEEPLLNSLAVRERTVRVSTKDLIARLRKAIPPEDAAKLTGKGGRLVSERLVEFGAAGDPARSNNASIWIVMSDGTHIDVTKYFDASDVVTGIGGLHLQTRTVKKGARQTVSEGRLTALGNLDFDLDPTATPGAPPRQNYFRGSLLALQTITRKSVRDGVRSFDGGSGSNRVEVFGQVDFDRNDASANTDKDIDPVEAIAGGTLKASKEAVVAPAKRLTPAPAANTPDIKAPTIDAGADQTVAVTKDTVVELRGKLGSGTTAVTELTPEQQRTTRVEWHQIAGPFVNLDFASEPPKPADALKRNFTLKATPVIPQNTVFSFRLTVSDPNGTSTDVVNVKIGAAADPTADAGADKTVAAGTTTPINLEGKGADPDGGTVKFAWTLPAGAVGTLTDADKATAKYLPPATVAAATDVIITLTVTDDETKTKTDTVKVTVTPVAAPAKTDPKVTVPGPVTIKAGAAAIKLTGSGSDDDGGNVTFKWTLDPATGSGTLTNDTAAEATFTPPDALPAINPFVKAKLTVTDDENVSKSAEVTITITAP